MSAKTDDPRLLDVPEQISLDDIKKRANAVKDLAVSEGKRVAGEAAQQDVTKVALIAVGVVVVVASLAYFWGTRSARRELPPFEV